MSGPTVPAIIAGQAAIATYIRLGVPNSWSLPTTLKTRLGDAFRCFKTTENIDMVRRFTTGSLISGVFCALGLGLSGTLDAAESSSARGPGADFQLVVPHVGTAKKPTKKTPPPKNLHRHGSTKSPHGKPAPKKGTSSHRTHGTK